MAAGILLLGCSGASDDPAPSFTEPTTFGGEGEGGSATDVTSSSEDTSSPASTSGFQGSFPATTGDRTVEISYALNPIYVTVRTDTAPVGEAFVFLSSGGSMLVENTTPNRTTHIFRRGSLGIFPLWRQSSFPQLADTHCEFEFRGTTYCFLNGFLFAPPVHLQETATLTLEDGASIPWTYNEDATDAGTISGRPIVTSESTLTQFTEFLETTPPDLLVVDWHTDSLNTVCQARTFGYVIAILGPDGSQLAVEPGGFQRPDCSTV